MTILRKLKQNCSQAWTLNFTLGLLAVLLVDTILCLNFLSIQSKFSHNLWLCFVSNIASACDLIFLNGTFTNYSCNGRFVIDSRSLLNKLSLALMDRAQARISFTLETQQLQARRFQFHFFKIERLFTSAWFRVFEDG